MELSDTGEDLEKRHLFMLKIDGSRGGGTPGPSLHCTTPAEFAALHNKGA
jgi:hypothetical protein